MKVHGVNHVNIVARDLDATAEFYERVLGLTARPLPMRVAGFEGRWLCDADDNAIIHLAGYNRERHGERRFGPQSGSIDHVALACRDFDAMLDHVRAIGVEHRVNDRNYGDLRQIFVTDPNDVVLELNFVND